MTEYQRVLREINAVSEAEERVLIEAFASGEARYLDEAFQSKGSLKTSGRWHRKGTQLAYAREHPGIAVLEKLAWLGSYEVARDSSYLLVPLEIDPDEHLERIEESELP